MKDYSRYESYKASGLEWPNRIPSHWKTEPIRAILQERLEKNTNRVTEFILSVTRDRGVIPYDEKGAVGNNKSEDIERYKLVYPDDLVINKMNVVIGSLGLSKYFGALSQVYVVLRSRNQEINISYYSYILANEVFYKSLIRFCTGIMELRESLNLDEFKKLRLPTPCRTEQNGIVGFLDRKTAEINRAIAQKIKLIELLNERRQILIHNAVTRGLDPNVKMKHSGVDWIGEIPEHWKVKPLRHLGKCQNGISQGAEYFGKGFPFVSYSDVYKNQELPPEVQGLANSTKAEREFYSVQAGDVLFTRTSETIEEIGLTSVCAKTIKDSTFAGFLIRFRPNRNVFHNRFSKFYFRSNMHRAFFVKEMNLVIRASLSQELLKKLPVLVIPISEQKEIAEYLESMSTKIDSLIGLRRKEIDKLKEYKAVLIDSAVTGKIKVS